MAAGTRTPDGQESYNMTVLSNKSSYVKGLRDCAQQFFDLQSIARALGGEVVGSQVLAPGPGHGPRDRSLSIKVSATAPEGFIAFSHAGDDFATCRDHVKRALGIEREHRRAPRPTLTLVHSAPPDHGDGATLALRIWRESIDPHNALIEGYLTSRGLSLDDDIAGEVLRWHPGVGAMVALFRNIETDKPQAISRTFLDPDGRKLNRKFLGPVGGAAIKLDPDDAVTGGLHIGEGIETCLAARLLGLRPCWALGSCTAIASFPVLPGVEALTILREHDDANARAADTVTTQWQTAGREVFDAWPNTGKDINDALLGVAK